LAEPTCVDAEHVRLTVALLCCTCISRCHVAVLQPFSLVTCSEVKACKTFHLLHVLLRMPCLLLICTWLSFLCA
jgi:hypothetical protein